MIRQTTSPPIIIHILASISRHLWPFNGSLIVNIILYPGQSLKLSSVFIVQMYGFEMVTNVQKCCAIICFITGTGDESTFGGNFFWPNLRQICNCFCNLSKFWWQQISDKSVELLLSSQILLLLPCALLSGVLKQIIESMSWARYQSIMKMAIKLIKLIKPWNRQAGWCSPPYRPVRSVPPCFKFAIIINNPKKQQRRWQRDHK